MATMWSLEGYVGISKRSTCATSAATGPTSIAIASSRTCRQRRSRQNRQNRVELQLREFSCQPRSATGFRHSRRTARTTTTTSARGTPRRSPWATSSREQCSRERCMDRRHACREETEMGCRRHDDAATEPVSILSLQTEDRVKHSHTICTSTHDDAHEEVASSGYPLTTTTIIGTFYSSLRRVLLRISPTSGRVSPRPSTRVAWCDMPSSRCAMGLATN